MNDCGTTVDSLLHRGLSFSDIRARYQSPAAASRDFRSHWRGATPDPSPEWLARRGIRRETLEACRPMVCLDGGGHLLFAHRDRNRVLTGFGIGPPDGPRRFATGGTRSLLAVRAGNATDLEILVITEGAVDALSLARIDGSPGSHAFLSTAGAPSRRQRGQIGLAARTLPNVRAIVLAQDGDGAREHVRRRPCTNGCGSRRMSRSAGAAHPTAPTGTKSSTPPRRADGPDRRHGNKRPNDLSPATDTPTTTAVTDMTGPDRPPKARETAGIPPF